MRNVFLHDFLKIQTIDIFYNYWRDYCKASIYFAYTIRKCLWYVKRVFEDKKKVQLGH